MYVDNVGAIFPSENTLVSQRTKHIYVRRHFICDYIEYGIAEIKIFQSEENPTYSITNNLSNGPFESLTLKYVY